MTTFAPYSKKPFPPLPSQIYYLLKKDALRILVLRLLGGTRDVQRRWNIDVLYAKYTKLSLTKITGWHTDAVILSVKKF